MSISQGIYIHEDLVVLNFEASNRKQVIEELGRRVLEKGYISEGFVDSVLTREEEYPTGLEMGIPIAIPHIGVYCNQSFLSFATLKKPVIFNSMDGSDKEIPAEVVFLFGIVNPSEQVEVLKSFIFAFREENNLRKLKEATDAKQAIEYLNILLNNSLYLSA